MNKKFVISFTLLFVLSGLSLWTILHNQSQILSIEAFQIADEPTPSILPSPSPTAAPVPKTPLTTSQISSDGSHLLKLVAKENTLTTDYSVYATTQNEPDGLPLYSTELISNNIISIPFNTWSPDDKYAFIQISSPDKTDYLVLNVANKTTEAPSSVTDLFTQDLPDYSIYEVTGWAAPGLLIVNSNKADGSPGPSFWFGVSNHKFTRLNTSFRD